MTARAQSVFAGACLALAGCTVGPEYRSPQVALPTAYRSAPAIRVSTAPVAETAWWRGFGDPGLTRAVERALAQNLDLAAARARIAQSRAAARAAGAALLPKAELQASAADQQQSLLDPFGVIARQVPGFERNHPLIDFGGAATWEIDLFGGLRRSREAARADAAAAGDDLRALQVSVAAETADAYLQLREAQTRVAFARRRLAVEDRSTDLLERAVADGGSSDRELSQARAAREAARAALPALQAVEAAQSARLDVLMGAPAGAYADETAVTAADLPKPPPLTGLGAPADLLRDRPDVAAAERRLAASNARVGAAISDYYPKISLSALLGVSSEQTGQVFVGDALQHQVSGALRWRLFDFGRVDAEVAAARGREAEALAGYRQAVYRATAEVETALAQRLRSGEQADALDAQVAELARTRAQVEAARRQGGAAQVQVLAADRDLLAASDAAAAARGAELEAAVAVYRATGGGRRAAP